MSCARETTLALFVMYLSPLMSEVYLLVNVLVNLFSELYVTFILQCIAFIFGRDEEEGQKVCHVQERRLSLFVLFLSPLTSEVYLFVILFTKLYITFILNWIAFIFGRDEDQ